MLIRHNIEQLLNESGHSSRFIVGWLGNIEHILESILRNLNGMAYGQLADENWTMLYASKGCEKLTGFKAEELLVWDTTNYEQITLPTDRERVRDCILEAIAQGLPYDLEYQITRSDGQVLWVIDRGCGVYSEDGKIQAIQGLMLDITERKISEQALLEAQRRYQSIFENTVEGIFQTTAQGGYISANPALAKLYGYESVDDLSAHIQHIQNQLYVNPTRRQEFLELMALNGRVSNFESQVYKRDGEIIWISENARAVRDEQGQLLYYEGTVEDITERKQHSALIEYQATHDELTDLPNRNLLKDRLQHAIAHAKRNKNMLAVVVVDIDNFKNINDHLGHQGADQVLIALSQRLKLGLRETDTVARLAGDEFVLVISEVHKVESLIQTLDRILDAIALPCVIDERELSISCSLGVSIFPRDGEDSESLLKSADMAMIQAKKLGKNNFQFFTPELNAAIIERIEIEFRMQNALTKQEFELHYQPKTSLATGEIVGLEALIRWHSADYGFTSPAKFIPIAEETSLIEQIGEWVIYKACEECIRLQKLTGHFLPISVNVSARQFYYAPLVFIVQSALVQTGLNPQYLEIEITEGTLIDKKTPVTAILHNLRALGIKLSIDDFGTGYSSLSYLKYFPLDYLKIDQSFVRDLENDVANQSILRAIVSLGHNLNLKVIAEGVETLSERTFLKSIGCDQMQGYLYSKPLAFDDLLRFLNESDESKRIIS